MSDAKSYLPPIEVGAPVRSGTLSQIVESNTEGWPVETILNQPIDGIEVYNLHQNMMENLGVAIELALLLEDERHRYLEGRHRMRLFDRPAVSTSVRCEPLALLP